MNEHELTEMTNTKEKTMTKNTMSTRQKETILYLVDAIKDITIISTDPTDDPTSDANMLFACFEVIGQIMTYNDDPRNIEFANKLKRFIRDELFPILDKVHIEEETP